MKSLGGYRIYDIVSTHHICTQNIYTDGKGGIFIVRIGSGHREYHKIDFSTYFVERRYTFQDETLNE